MLKKKNGERKKGREERMRTVGEAGGAEGERGALGNVVKGRYVGDMDGLESHLGGRSGRGGRGGGGGGEGAGWFIVGGGCGGGENQGMLWCAIYCVHQRQIHPPTDLLTNIPLPYHIPWIFLSHLSF